jgi:uncharacterized membrane protein
MIVLTALGLVVASYLTYIHYAGIKPLCGRNGGGCEIVQTSAYSKLAGVPVALIGLLGYIAILGSLLVRESETSRFATVAFTVIGFGFSAYLTYRELFTIHHICEYCVSSAVVVTILMCLAVWRFLRGEETPGQSRPPELGSDPAAPLGSAGS